MLDRLAYWRSFGDEALAGSGVLGQAADDNYRMKTKVSGLPVARSY